MANKIVDYKTINAKDGLRAFLNTDTGKQMLSTTFVDPRKRDQIQSEMFSIIGSDSKIGQCNMFSVLSACITAATLQLPFAPSLGQAYIIPYGNKAQFQIGYKGLIQLALRTGQYRRLGTNDVHEGDYKGRDEFNEPIFEFKEENKKKPIIGYMAYLELINGFKKTFYWTKEECELHGREYSKNYNGLWTDKFDIMAKKTVLKQLISHFGSMSTEMQYAIKSDQMVFGSDGQGRYLDNPNTSTKIVDLAVERLDSKSTITNALDVEETPDVVEEPKQANIEPKTNKKKEFKEEPIEQSDKPIEPYAGGIFDLTNRN